jgi:hypothetical protein
VLTADVVTVSRSRKMCRVTVFLLSPRLVFVERIRFAKSSCLLKEKPETTVFIRLIKNFVKTIGINFFV